MKMDELYSKLILSTNMKQFFDVLSTYYQKNINLHELLMMPENDEKKSILKLYRLLFEPLEGQSNNQLYINDLLNHHYTSEAEALKIYKLLKKEHCLFYQLAIINHKDIEKIVQIGKQIEKLIPNVLWTIKDQYGVFIFTFDHGPYITGTMEETLLSMIDSYQARMYLSYPYDRFIDSPGFYEQTKLMVDLYLPLDNTLITFEDHYLWILFSAFGQRKFLNSLIHPNIHRIINHDQKYHTPYYQTLKVYLENKRDIQKTIEQLDINKSTLFYRFKQIGKMLNVDFHDIDLFAYEFSIRIYEYLNH